MHVKDKQYLTNIFNTISASVNAINGKIIAHRQGKASVEELIATAALEQVSMQQEILLVLAMLVADAALIAEALPEMPKKIIGFN
jgi:hypothetical protein